MDHGFVFCLKLLLIMKKHLFDVKVEQKKKYLSKKRDYIIAIYKHSRTEYKKIRPFLERGISFRVNSRTGYQKLAYF